MCKALEQHSCLDCIEMTDLWDQASALATAMAQTRVVRCCGLTIYIQKLFRNKHLLLARKTQQLHWALGSNSSEDSEVAITDGQA